MLLEGLHIPLTTPFHSDGRLHPQKLAANVERYSKTPAAGLIVLGPSGEPTLLSDEETREVMTTAASAAAPEKILIAGIFRDGVRAALEFAEFAAAQQYDAVLVPVPSVLAAKSVAEAALSRELLTFFQTIADRSPLPLVLYRAPDASGQTLSIETVAELAQHPKIIAMLDSIGAAAQPSQIAEILRRTSAVQHQVAVNPVFAAVTRRMQKAAAYDTANASGTFIAVDTLAESLTGLLGAFDTGAATALLAAPPVPTPNAPARPLRARTKAVGFQVLGGATASVLASLRAGASGMAPTFSACAPQACYEVFAAWKDGDQPLAEEKQKRLLNATALAEQIGGTAGLKFGCDLNGYFGGQPRLPHLPLNGEQRAVLEQSMAGMRN